MELLPDRVVIAGVTVYRGIVPHPLLGEAQQIEHAGTVITAMTPLDWERPAQIPAIAEPARLPPGAGAAILNAIAVRARAAGVAALRYAGPYPTPALYRALLRSFRASGDEATFTHDVLARALRVARDELPIDFAPAPHERRELAGARGHAELRDGLERVVLDGVMFEHDGSPARLVRDASGARWAAEIWFGDAVWAHIAEISDAGALLAGPFAIPPCTSPVLGRDFPDALRAALGELVAELVPPPLAAAARAQLAEHRIAWADLGARAARRAPAGTGFEVHAALWDRIAPRGLGRLALALAEALAPVVTSAVVAQLVAVAPSLG